MSETISSLAINGDDGSPGFGIYVHWPFCAAKCPYCDFNSHVRHGGVDQAAFLAAYKQEIAAMREATGPRAVTSVFFGGGTPSLMEPQTLDGIVQALETAWGLPSGIEITMEANPQSADAARFKAYAQSGVNRLSLGVQALNDADLKFLGRLHNRAEALAAIELARDTFARLSFDLIYARPGQTLEAWEAELAQAAQYAVDHLSAYQLTIEEGTPFKALCDKGTFALPDQELSADMYEVTQEATAALGLPCYEVSNHAKLGAESRHNLTYWRYGDYVGVGPGAHGRFTDLRGTKFATAMILHPETWAQKVGEAGMGVADWDALDVAQQGDEMLLMGLRLVEGFDLARHETLTGTMISDAKIQAMVDLGMIERRGNARIAATAKGRIVLNAVIAELAV